MNNFVNYMGDVIDFDVHVFKDYPDSVPECVAEIQRRIGYAMLWMVEYTDNREWGLAQRMRVESFVLEYGLKLKADRDRGLRWYQEQLYRLRDEIENMC